MGSSIMAMLFISFFIGMFVAQLSGSLKSLGYRVPVWINIGVTVLIIFAFAATHLFPGTSVEAFHP